MYDRMIQAEIDYRRDRMKGTPVRRRRPARSRIPFLGRSEAVSRRVR